MRTPNPEVKALVLFALIEGVAQQYVFAPDEYPLEAVVTEVLTLFATEDVPRKGNLL